MDLKARANLVATILDDREEKRRRWSTRRHEPRAGEGSFDDYNARRMRTEPDYGGDGSIRDAAARWDRHRSRLPKPARLRTPRAPRDPDGYVGYTGDWQRELGGVRVIGRRRRKT